MNRNFVIVGLPGSGKTTFLAALWHLVESGEEACRLHLSSYKGDLAYLNLIAEAWRTFQPVPRTSQVGDVDVVIELIDRETSAKATAFFPDLGGETFDTQVEARRCRPELIDRVAADDGVLLFISADVKGNALSIVEFNARMPSAADEPEGKQAADNVPDHPADVGAPPDANGGDGGRPMQSPPEWEPKLLPPQVRVVQLLTDMLRTPFTPRRRRLVVLVSAWDLAQRMRLQPAQWLAVQMPLVDQFLRTNGGSFEYCVYGVSAQGVNLTDGAAVGRAARLVPSRRILILGPEGEGHDLTAPLVWLMSER